MAAVERKIDKSAWGEGPWMHEPDRKEWRDAETGLPCLAIRGPMGNWCGYTAVSEGHPAYGKDYDDVRVDAHGGLTYAGKCNGHICHTPDPGEPGNVHWLGFDCAHSGDFIPSMDAMRKPGGVLHDIAVRYPGVHDGDVYRDLPYVEAECASLAKQLAAMA